MNTNSNGYTLTFTAILVLVVSVLLAFTAVSLKPAQKENMRKEKMQNILASVGIEVSAQDAQGTFDKQLVDQIILDANGVAKESKKTAFEVDVLKEYKSGLNSIYSKNSSDKVARTKALIKKGANYPLFILKDKEGKENYIIPVVGNGLWGPIWGYVALSSDKNTVSGATFDHKTETPGLGAEITEPFFQDPWVGKKVFGDNGEFKSIKVVKGGADDFDLHGVDAISGGTITSNGVSEMVERTLSIYESYLTSK